MDYSDLVKDKGLPVLHKTPYCEQFLAEHDGVCCGCESEAGCRKAIEINLMVLNRMLYKPVSFADAIESDNILVREIERILSTIEEPERGLSGEVHE